jgi:hypothetical protein
MNVVCASSCLHEEKMMVKDKTCDIKNNKKMSRGADKIERKQLKRFASTAD